MRIYSLSKILGLPVVLTLAGMAYYHYVLDVEMGMYMFIPIAIIVVLMISHPYIDYWYHTKYPLPLDEEIKSWLRKYSSFYNNLDASDKEKYHYRMSLYLEARSFKSVGSEQKDLPEDIKAIIASNAIEIGFHEKDFLIGDFDRIFLYTHPFPSPRHQFLHSVETQTEDGVIIYSLEHLVPGMIDSRNYYNIGMHAFVEAFMRVHPAKNFPDPEEFTWEIIEEISGQNKKRIHDIMGFQSIDITIVGITCYFTYPEEFRRALPEINKKLNRIFSRDF